MFGVGFDGIDVEYETDRLTITGDNQGRSSCKLETQV